MEEHTSEDEREGSEATLVQLWWPRRKEGADGTFETPPPDVTKQIECKRFLVGWWHSAADSQHLVVTVVATVAAKVLPQQLILLFFFFD
jgi:hypothetical protein